MTTKQHRTSFITTKFSVLFFAGPTWLPLFLAYNLCAWRPKAASYKPQTYFPPTCSTYAVQGPLLTKSYRKVPTSDSDSDSDSEPAKFAFCGPVSGIEAPLFGIVFMPSTKTATKHICTRFAHSIVTVTGHRRRADNGLVSLQSAKSNGHGSNQQ